MDHLTQLYLHFPFISNWQMKGFVLLLKEFQAFAQSGGGGNFGPKGEGPRPLSSWCWLIVPEEWAVGERRKIKVILQERYFFLQEGKEKKKEEEEDQASCI